ncbi:DapH/DapD/GlmU-related protein [Gemmatimonas sp.]|jgi:UDP-2-acetamido-3-amino-2,3-dideoxy-glucuronate N-acetyltransferase|uniref:acyltransferase n=1 Tax=Gemmatimonas sp. TaxID=1962908 RepID=UPI0037BFC9C1
MIAAAGQGHVALGAVLGEGALVHESAYVDAGAVIGAETRVWHFCHVLGGAVIGPRCSLGQNVVVMNGVVVGENAKIQNNVSLYEGVELEADVFCGPSMVFTNVYNPRSAVSRKHEYRRTLVRRGATIGANATIVCGVTIGRFAFVGAGAVVNRDVPDYALVAGVPGKRIGWMSEDGYKLESLSLSADEGGHELLRCPGTDVRYERHGDVVVRLEETV